MTERWTDVRGHPGYEVSSIGRVRNKQNERVLATHLNRKGGYLRVTLDGKHHYIHRLVADSFYDGNHGGLKVNHINGDKTDNTLSNLEWRADEFCCADGEYDE